MQRRALIGGALAALGGCGTLFEKSWTIRYRLTVATTSPAAEASSVIETRYAGPVATVFGLPSSYLYRTNTWGDAPSFATPGGGRLFAMFSGNLALAGVGEHAFAPTHERTLVSVLEDADNVEAFETGRLFDKLVTITGARALARARWPRLIWLSDDADLTTAHFVTLPGFEYRLPADFPQRSLADVWGRDAAIAGVTIERTDEPISQDAYQRFAWLNGMNGDDGALIWNANSPFWANLQRPYFALRGENNEMTR